MQHNFEGQITLCLHDVHLCALVAPDQYRPITDFGSAAARMHLPPFATFLAGLPRHVKQSIM